MHSDRYEIEEYPFWGKFYIPNNERAENGDLIGDDDEPGEDTIVLETSCDIQETNKMFNSGAITASFNIYFPFDKKTGIEIRRGMMFKSEVYKMPISGTVVGVYPCQKGGCVAYIKDTDV